MQSEKPQTSRQEWLALILFWITVAAVTYFGATFYFAHQKKIEHFAVGVELTQIDGYPIWIEDGIKEKRISQYKNTYDILPDNIKDWIEEGFEIRIGSYDSFSDKFGTLTIGGQTYLPVYNHILHMTLVPSVIYIDNSVYPYVGDYIDGHFDSIQRVFIHEIGHLVDLNAKPGAGYYYSNSPEFTKLYEENKEHLVTRLSEYSGQDIHEGFAECFAAYILQPDLLDGFPEVYDYIAGTVTSFQG